MTRVVTGTGTLEAESGGHAIVVPGIVVGVLGGVAMAVFLIFAAEVNGLDPLGPLHSFGETFTEPDRPHGRPAFLVYGLFLHLAVSVLLAMLFVAMLPPQFPVACVAVAGIGFTVGVMAFMTGLVLPAVNPELRAAMPALGGSWVIAHAIYGVSLGFAPRVQARLRPA